ncbi:MAG: hypothetical protein HOP32_09555 [Nitrospira sp.]|nr:hypothetical protein [Nitrospira sp.]
MNTKLFQLALDRLEPSDWAHFEKLSSAFLLPEFSTLRTMAHPSGDGGRDSELFSPDGMPLIAAQYSVAANWKSKVRQTAKRIAKECPNIRILVYMTNRVIGGQADALKGEILKEGLSLDIRDRNWFLERADSDSQRENASCELIDRIARPYLVGESIINKSGSPLSTNEARAALVYLGLQWQDDATDKGLTKLSFDALVRAALRHTTSEKRMTRKAVHDAVSATLPSADVPTITRFTNSALDRLTKRFIRHWKKEDEFCLTSDEHQRILSRLSEVAIQQSEFSATIGNYCEDCLRDIEAGNDKDREDLQERVPRIMDKLLLRRGESFVTAVMSDQLDRVDYGQLDDIILADIHTHPPQSSIMSLYPQLASTIIRAVFAGPNQSIQPYLRRQAASYTLFSFLKQTPDVQSATRKLFSHGTIWIDTSVILPVFAEQLEEDEAIRRLSRLLLTCRDHGVELRITSGVIQEVNAHMNNAISCSNHAKWQGRIPYLYSQHIQTGRPSPEFGRWISLFRGSARPDDDLAQYLAETFGIIRQDLDDAQDQVGEELRWAVDRLWGEAHQVRRSNTYQSDESTTRLLIKHDIEMYLGVIALRKKEAVSELGYRHWLLTLDTIAWMIRDKLKEEFKSNAPTSPLMSMSYLFDSIAFGSDLRSASRARELTLPLILDVEMSESAPHDFIDIADSVRKEHEGLPEYVVRRKVRDAIDRARHRGGLS